VEARSAAQSHTGEIWTAAMQKAVEAREAEQPSGMSFMDLVMSPGLWISYPWYMITGKTLSGRSDMPLLPATRTGNAIKAVTDDTPLAQLGVFAAKILGAPENAFRKAKGMSEFGDYGNYYIDRQLADMVQEGVCSLKDAKLAMIQRNGPLFVEAQKRMMLESAFKVPGALATYGALHGGKPEDIAAAMLFGMAPAGLLPDAELETRQLKDEYDAAREAYNGGDTEAIDRFFAAYPEYEARSALWDTPEERLRNFMITGIWEGWQTLGSVEKEQLQAQLGDQFNDYFLNKDSRNYELIQDETLAYWGKIMNATIPQNVEPVAPEGTVETPAVPVEMEATVNAYRMLRKSLFPNYYAMSQRYFALPQGSQERKDFLVKYPKVKEYFEWNTKYKTAHPEVAEYADTYAPPEYDYTFMNEFTTPLVKQLYSYYLNETPLSSGAIAELNRLYKSSGQQGGSFEAFIEFVIRPKLSP
jgi:hypothetical protein